MIASREAFNIRVKACRRNIVPRLYGRYGAKPYWTKWLVKMVLMDTRNKACEVNDG